MLSSLARKLQSTYKRNQNRQNRKDSKNKPVVVSESTPLLSHQTKGSIHGPSDDDEAKNCNHNSSKNNNENSINKGNDSTTNSTSSFPVLFELIGARNIPVDNLETYCVIQYGPRTIHRTKPFSPKISRTSRITQALFMNRLFGGSEQDLLQRSLRDPIWTIQENSLLTVSISPSDLENKKALTITLWGRPRSRGGVVTGGQQRGGGGRARRHLQSIGKIRIQAPTLLEECTEQRMELQLMNELGQPIVDDQDEPTLIAYRCRIASPADVAFVDHWNQTPRPQQWNDTDIIPEPELPRARLITELPESEIQAMAPALINAIPPPQGHVRIKPYPDPRARPEGSRFISKESLKTQTSLPSRNWIQAGSKPSTLGRLYIEILSAHDLPNVDIGGKVGNETDAFCAVVYGDAMTQTDVIFDELNPHWPCWSQRAFCFHMQHPSHVLYLAVFGYKRSPLQHRPIGRVEINPIHFQNHVTYNLDYDLCGSSHAIDRQAQGRIRIRIRMETDDERRTLLAALRPPPTVYINTIHRKSMIVARYTACGEYDNQTRFSLQVLQGYIDELLEGYLRRILYALQDGTRSLILWRSQIYMGRVGVPIYSLLAFAMGMMILERPQLIPSMMCFAMALFFLHQMQSRVSCPSPWRRCCSFWQYLSVLIGGGHGNRRQCNITISAHEGADAWEAQQQALRDRIAHDKEFIEKKEALAKQIEEIENSKVQTDSQPIPMEILIVLGKVQGIVGDICRLCRLINAIITWEESHVAFWITLALLLLGVIFMIIPWGWLFKWIGRLFIVLLLGPQNKLLDWWWYQNIPTDDQRIYQIFSARMFEARCRQENTHKLKYFRHVLFGKYATWVPPLFWSPHQDFPLPSSTAHGDGGSKVPPKENMNGFPYMPGQQLHGVLIPRPERQWRRNVQESKDGKEKAQAFYQGIVDSQVSKLATTATMEDLSHRSSNILINPLSIHSTSPSVHSSRRESTTLEHEGLEILELYDEEAGFVERVLYPEESTASEYANDSTNIVEEEEQDVDEPMEYTTSSSTDDEASMILPVSADPVRILPQDREDQQSMIELGFEFAQPEQAMAAFKAMMSDTKEQSIEPLPTPIESVVPSSSSTLTNLYNSSTNRLLRREEKWETDIESGREEEPPEIPHSVTIVDADEGETSDGDCGFEVIE